LPLRVKGWKDVLVVRLTDAEEEKLRRHPACIKACEGICTRHLELLPDGELARLLKFRNMQNGAQK
jgi:hypothetical protein